MEIETEVETMKECCLMVCSSWLVQATFLIQFRPTSLGMLPHTEGWPLQWWRQFFNWSFLFPGVSSWQLKLAMTSCWREYKPASVNNHKYHRNSCMFWVQISGPIMIHILYDLPTSLAPICFPVAATCNQPAHLSSATRLKGLISAYWGLSLLHSGISEVSHHAWLIQCWRSNQELHACVASVLHTESHPLPLPAQTA